MSEFSYISATLRNIICLIWPNPIFSAIGATVFWVCFFFKKTKHTLFCTGSEVKWSEVKSLSRVRLFATPWAVAYQVPLSMGFSRQ